MYIWQSPEYPKFTYHRYVLGETLTSFLLNFGRLGGSIQVLDDDSQKDVVIDLMLSEALSTSYIENEILDRESVRSSLKRHLGLTTSAPRDPKSAGIAALMVDVRQCYDKPLTKELLCRWHKMVIPEEPLLTRVDRGEYRSQPDDMQITSGPIGFEKVHYVAPPSKDVESQMQRFVDWYNGDVDIVGEDSQINPLVKASIAHLWFECIHPFEDGNGRIGRAIAEHCLHSALGSPQLLTLSAAIERDRLMYYRQLEMASTSGIDISGFIKYFSDVIIKAQEMAATTVNAAIGKTRFWDKHKHTDISERQRKMLVIFFKHGVTSFPGGISARKYASISGCSKATATRDLVDLTEKSILISTGEGRGTRYHINLPRLKSDLLAGCSENDDGKPDFSM